MALAPNETRRSSHAALVIVGVLAGLALKALSDTEGYDTARLYLAMQFAPFLYDLFKKQAGYVGLLGLASFAFTGVRTVSILTDSTGTVAFDQEQIIAMRETCICYVLLWLAHQAFTRLVKKRESTASSFQKLEVAPATFIGAMAMLPVTYFAPVSRDYLNLVLLLSALCNVLCLTTTCKRAPILDLIAPTYVFALAFVRFLMTGMYGPLITPTFALLFGALITRNPRMLPWPMVAIVLFLFIQPVKGFYRGIARDPTLSISERFTSLGALLIESHFGESILADDAETKILDRLDEDTLARVIRFTPGIVPYWGGVTYEAVLFVFIPRFLWRDKPKLNWGNRFGKEYQVLSEEDSGTSITCGYYCEGYINFGFLGMYGVAILMGLLLGAVESLALNRFSANYTLPFILGFGPFSQQPAMATIFNNIVLTVIPILILSLVLTRKNAQGAVWPTRAPQSAGV